MSKSSNYQLARAHELVFKNGVAKVDNNVYQVKSSTNPSLRYVVSDNVCSCKGFVFSGHCSHIAAVRLFKQGENKIEA